MAKTATYQSKDVHINMKKRRELMSKVKAIESLTKDDMVKLKMLKDQKIDEIKE